MIREINTIIIGGGISGLSSAHFLKKKNVDYILLESEKKLGGVIQTIKSDGFIFENGPNTIINNNSSINQIIKDYKLNNKIIGPDLNSNSKRFVFYSDNPVAVPNGIWSFLTTPLLSFISKILIFKDFFVKPHNQNTSVFDFISKRFGKQFHDNLIEPFLTGIYAGNTKKMSAKHSLRRLWDFEQTHGSVLKGFLMSNKKNIKSFNFSSGLYEIIFQLKKKLSRDIKTNQKVVKIKKIKKGYEVLTNDNTFICKNIISTIPSHALAKVLFDDDLKIKLSKLEYNPIDVFHFVFKKDDIKNDLDGFGILAKPSDKKSFLGIIFSNKIFPHLCPKEYNLYTVLAGGEMQKDLLKMPEKKLQKTILEELKSLIKCNVKPYKTNHFSWKKGIPQYNKFQEDLEQSISLFHKKNKSFKIVGNYHSGVSVSDCIKNAETAVLEIL